ncbi:MAG: hypothetical protein GX584_04085 [Clostridiaceae bacterium]|nr:hypothetical protein [Clostridiaceae bacterium]
MKKALIMWGGWLGHEPEQVGKIFQDVLKEEGFEVTRTDKMDVLADLDNLKQFDLFVPIWTMDEIKKEYVDNVSEALGKYGTGLAGNHGGMCDSFRQSTKWQFITGSQWVDHPGNDGIEYMVNIKKSSDSKIIEGINDFKVVSEQYYVHVDPAVNVLATTRFPVYEGYYATNGCVDVPVVYTKKWGKAKVFYNSLGHVANVFDIPEALELMRRGFIWAAR